MKPVPHVSDHAIYIIACVKNGELVAPVKVGISSNPEKRLRSIQTSCPYEVRIVHVFTAPSREIAFALEAGFHATQASARTSGEWFEIEPPIAMLLMCMNYRVALAARCRTLTEDEIEKCMEIAGVLAAEDALHKMPGRVVQ